MDALIRNSWMMMVRAVLAVAFGLALLSWPGVTLSVVVVLFGVYAMLDGAWAIAAGARASRRWLDAWPVALEGLVSVGLGVLALGWPFVSRRFLYVIAGWGIATGVLEIAAAITLPRHVAGHWLLGTAGASSMFLAFLILSLPHADVEEAVPIIGTYAIAFGAVVAAAAVRFRHDRQAPRPGGAARIVQPAGSRR
jgi:uncharacterized membrane protein HdeD (DUF308 family)